MIQKDIYLDLENGVKNDDASKMFVLVVTNEDIINTTQILYFKKLLKNFTLPHSKIYNPLLICSLEERKKGLPTADPYSESKSMNETEK